MGCLQDKDSAVETSISISLKKRGKGCKQGMLISVSGLTNSLTGHSMPSGNGNGKEVPSSPYSSIKP